MKYSRIQEQTFHACLFACYAALETCLFCQGDATYTAIAEGTSGVACRTHNSLPGGTAFGTECIRFGYFSSAKRASVLTYVRFAMLAEVCQQVQWLAAIGAQTLRTESRATLFTKAGIRLVHRMAMRTDVLPCRKVFLQCLLGMYFLCMQHVLLLLPFQLFHTIQLIRVIKRSKDSAFINKSEVFLTKTRARSEKPSSRSL